jgi:hypothetical protein
LFSSAAKGAITNPTRKSRASKPCLELKENGIIGLRPDPVSWRQLRYRRTLISWWQTDGGLFAGKR